VFKIFVAYNFCPTDLSVTKDGSKTQPTNILTPSEALLVFTDPNEERFGAESDDPTVLERRAEVMNWEDGVLKKYIDKSQLTRWAQAVIEQADRALRFERGAVNGNGFANGNGKGSNGHVVDSVENGEDEQLDDGEDEIA